MAAPGGERVRRIVASALERDPAQWPAYLDTACGEDGSLRREVEELLDDARRGVRQPRSDVSAPTLTSDPAAEPPAAVTETGIGPYRILQEIGRGGMGTVYLAVRDDDQYRKRVAIKLLRRDVESDDISRRFRNERQILAAIDHPYIAKLLDGGSTSDGRPYFVMEHIEGKPIDAYCDAKRLAIAERVALLRKVCAAVHFAHQNLVVHRDLKPGNILVTDDGTPKLLDFGIAKLLNPELSSQTVEITRFEVRLMTPEYASPEQVQGEPITTASDVYSLGVLLYELLTGHRPYRFPSRRMNEIARVICEEEPASPSTVVMRTVAVEGPDGNTQRITPDTVSRAREISPERLSRRLKGDLDNIVLTAMHKERARRYVSAEQLAEDLRRYLEGLPVKARRGTWVYRVSKLVRRHRLAFAAAAACLLFLVGSLWVAVGERRRAEREAARARAVVEFLISALAAVDPRVALGSEPTVRSLLEEAERRLGAGHALPAGEAAAVRKAIAESRFQLGHYREAERDFAILAADSSGDAPLEERIDALVGLSFSQAELNKLREAEANARQALSLAARRPQGESHLRAQNAMAKVHLLYGTSDHRQQAEAILEHSGKAVRALPPRHPERAATLQLLADLHLSQSRFAEAAEQASQNYRNALEAFGSQHPITLEALSTQTLCLVRLSRYAEALEILQKHVESVRRVLGDDHAHTLQARALLGSSLRSFDRFEESRSVYLDLLARQTRVLGDKHPATLTTRYELALLAKDLKDAVKAETLMRELVVDEREVLGPNHPDTLRSEMMVALTLFQQKRLEDSRDAYSEVLPRIKENVGEASPVYLVGMSNFAGLLYRLGDYPAAERMFRESLAAHQRVFGEQHFGTYYNRMELGTTLMHEGRYEEAEQQLLASLAGFRGIFNDRPTHQRIADSLGRLVDLYDKSGASEKASRSRAQLAELGSKPAR